VERLAFVPRGRREAAPAATAPSWGRSPTTAWPRITR